MDTDRSTSPSNLLKIPYEIRQKILGLALPYTSLYCGHQPISRRGSTALLFTCLQIRTECLLLLYSSNTFPFRIIPHRLWRPFMQASPEDEPWITNLMSIFSPEPNSQRLWRSFMQASSEAEPWITNLNSSHTIFSPKRNMHLMRKFYLEVTDHDRRMRIGNRWTYIPDEDEQFKAHTMVLQSQVRHMVRLMTQGDQILKKVHLVWITQEGGRRKEQHRNTIMLPFREAGILVEGNFDAWVRPAGTSW